MLASYFIYLKLFPRNFQLFPHLWLLFPFLHFGKSCKNKEYKQSVYIFTHKQHESCWLLLSDQKGIMFSILSNICWILWSMVDFILSPVRRNTATSIVWFLFFYYLTFWTGSKKVQKSIQQRVSCPPNLLSPNHSDPLHRGNQCYLFLLYSSIRRMCQSITFKIYWKIFGIDL